LSTKRQANGQTDENQRTQDLARKGTGDWGQSENVGFLFSRVGKNRGSGWRDGGSRVLNPSSDVRLRADRRRGDESSPAMIS
jgi:hypothetical protein